MECRLVQDAFRGSRRYWREPSSAVSASAGVALELWKCPKRSWGGEAGTEECGRRQNLKFAGVNTMPSDLEERVQRLEDAQEIQKLMSRYAYFLTPHMYCEIADQLFSKKTQCQKVQIAGWGIWEGPDAAARCYGAHEWMAKTLFGLPGTMMQHSFTTPYIEVAGDGLTAKGLWISPGHEARPSEGDVTAYWVWVVYSDDFVKEDSVWRVWHHRVTEVLFSPAQGDWIAGNVQSEELNPEWPDEFKPDRPSPPQWKYSPTSICIQDPPIPEPYETWSDDKSYID